MASFVLHSRDDGKGKPMSVEMHLFQEEDGYPQVETDIQQPIGYGSTCEEAYHDLMTKVMDIIRLYRRIGEHLESEVDDSYILSSIEESKYNPVTIYEED